MPNPVAQELLEHARASGPLSVKLAVSESIRRRDAEAAEQLFRELRQQTGWLARQSDVRAVLGAIGFPVRGVRRRGSRNHMDTRARRRWLDDRRGEEADEGGSSFHARREGREALSTLSLKFIERPGTGKLIINVNEGRVARVHFEPSAK